METLARFRSMVMRLSIGIMLALAAAAWVWDRAAAEGVLLGGIAGILGFWLMVRNAEVANRSPNRVRFRTQLGLALRMVGYALVLVKAQSLDPVHYRGFLGAAIGLVIARVAVSVVGAAGWDLKKSGG